MPTKYTKKELEQQIIGKLRRNFGREVEEATSVHMFRACALVLRDIMSARELATQSRIRDTHARQVHYLSLEFLMGRSLEKNAYNLGVLPQLKEAIEDLASPPPISSRWSPTPVWATAAWAAWPPATWRP